METQFLGLRTVIYAVSDIIAATKWYSKMFDTKPYFEEDCYVGFNIKGYESGLQPDNSNSQKTENIATHWGVLGIEFTFNLLIQNGAKPNQEPVDVGEGIMMASVFDPWNNILGIIYNPYFKIN